LVTIDGGAPVNFILLGCTHIRRALCVDGFHIENLGAKAFFRARYPRRCYGCSAVRPSGDRSLLASMGVLVDLHERLGSHYDVSHEEGPGTS